MGVKNKSAEIEVVKNKGITPRHVDVKVGVVKRVVKVVIIHMVNVVVNNMLL